MSTGSRSSFGKVQFGFASAETESVEAPDLLRDGFLDPRGYVKEALRGPKFLFLGFKGTGKTSIGMHLNLVAEDDPELFFTYMTLSDLSYRTLGSLVDEDVELEVRFPKAWAWVLLVALLRSATSDQSIRCDNSELFESTVAYLSDAGVLVAGDASDLVTASSGFSWEASAWGVTLAGSKDAGKRRLGLGVLTQHLLDLLKSTRTDCRHILFVDGLDHVLLSGSDQLQAIAGLMSEVAKINTAFRAARANFKIIVVCRTDLFERLPGPNLNKIRQDLAVELQWYQEGSGPEQSALIQLVNERTRLESPWIRNAFAYFFPRDVGGKSPERFLLDFTRHTPRDLIQLLRSIQDVGDSARISHYQARAGSRRYSEKYFVPELKNELDGYLERPDIDRLFEALRQYHRRRFSQSELEEFLLKNGQRQLASSIAEALRTLYVAGGVGNSFTVGNGQRRFTFRFRNPTSHFNPNDEVVAHNALARALQLEYIY